MNTHESEDELFEAEDKVSATDDAGSNSGHAADFGDQANAMVDDIKSDSLYELRTQTEFEDIDPESLHSDTVVVAEDIVSDADDDSRLAAANEVDELSESIEIADDLPFVYVEQQDDEDASEKAARSRRRLRNVLIFFIVVLVLIAVAIGVFVWRNNTPPDVKQTDPDALQASKVGASAEIFQPIDAGRIPDFVTYFGMTPEEAAAGSGGAIALDAEATPAADESMPALKSLRNAWLVGTNGEVAASITFGLGQDGKIVYTLVTFDLDAYGVADAKFNELTTSSIIAASFLTGIGIDDATVSEAKVTVTDKPEAVVSRDTAGREVVEFAGSTNREAAPTAWKLTETYDHTAGASLGDNSVIRSLSIDLR